MLEEAGVGYVLAVPKSQQVISSGQLAHRPCPRPVPRPRRGSGSPAVTVRRGRGSTTGPRPSCPPWTVRSPPTAAGCWPAAAWRVPRRSPITWPSRPRTPLSRTGSGRRCRVGDRGVLPGREERVRPGPVRSPPLRGLVPPHHPGHARARLPGGDDGPGPRKGGRRNGSSGLVPLTVAEVRRLLDLAHPPSARHRSPARRFYWSRWRRRHQAIARRCHYQRRTRPDRVSHEPPPT